MLRRNLIRRTFPILFLSAVALFAAIKPAHASAVQVTLNNLAFDGFFGPEVLDGSFLVDPATDEATSSNILATGDIPLQFFGVDITGSEPFEFALDDGYGDFLFLNLSSGLFPASYGFADIQLLPSGLLAPLGFTFQLASSGSFSVSAASAAPTPEPSTLLLLCAGTLLLCFAQSIRRR